MHVTAKLRVYWPMWLLVGQLFLLMVDIIDDLFKIYFDNNLVYLANFIQSWHECVPR